MPPSLRRKRQKENEFVKEGGTKCQKISDFFSKSQELPVEKAESSEKHSAVSLRPQKGTISSITCTLDVPNFFTRPEYERRKLDISSPPFDFASATWCFTFTTSLFSTSNDLDDDDDEDEYERDIYDRDIYARLSRLKSETPRHKIFATFLVLGGDDDDTVFRKRDHVIEFDGDERVTLASISNYFYLSRDTLTVTVHLASAETEVAAVNRVPDTSQRGVLLRQDLKDVLLNGQDHNITFNVGDKKIKAHRDILQARSEVFHSMLSHDMLEANSGTIDLPDCDPQAFEQFLFYVYAGETPGINEKNMFELYYVADKYNCMQLKEDCSCFIKKSLSVSNLRHAVELAAKHSDEGLMNSALRFFNRKADAVWPSDEWQLFLKENFAVANEFISKSFEKSRGQSSN